MHWDWTFEDAKQSMAHEVTTMPALMRNDNGCRDDSEGNTGHADNSGEAFFLSTYIYCDFKP